MKKLFQEIDLLKWKKRIKKRSDRLHRYKEKKHLSKIGGKPLYKGTKKSILNKYLYKIEAPDKLSLSRHNHERFSKFLRDLYEICKRASSDKMKVHIDLSLVSEMYGDACILFIATIDNIKNLYPSLLFKIKRPKRSIESNYNPDAVFCHLGVYEKLGFKYTADCSGENVSCWKYVYSNVADPWKIEPLMDELEQMGMNPSNLFRSSIEGIANAVEHAYMKKISSNTISSLGRWWMLLARLEDRLILIVCDLGHGIPNTLEYTQDSSLLDKIFNFLNILRSSSKDCAYIQASLLVKETRTLLGYRGKGGNDIKSFIDKTDNSRLIIHSNRGTLIYKGNKDGHKTNGIGYDNKHSINGTIIQWSFPIK